MLRTYATVRTVWSQDLVTEQRQGTNGPYDYKSILFRVATDRNYKTTQIVDGKQVTDYPTDFILCRATGAVAEAFANNCTAKDKEGKLLSRHLSLIGHIETYQSPRKVPVNAQINYAGQLLNVSLETEIKVDGHIFVVEEFEFLDAKPREVSTIAGATVSNVSISPAQPATVPAQAQTMAPVPVQAGTPIVAPVAQNVTPVYQANPIANAMNAPIPQVDTNFQVAGQTAPF